MSSVKANSNPTASSTNRYSLFDGLDHIASTPPDLTLGPPSFKSTRRIEDETIRRLSASLNNLISQQHGRNQLPELPVPTYDNGNVDLSIVRPARRQSPLIPQGEAEADSRHAPIIRKTEPEPEPEPRISDISSELDDPIDYRIFSRSSHLLAHVDSPVRTQYGTVPCPSAQRSRPVSMYNSPTTQRARCNTRPETSGSQAGQSWHHKKAISYSEQRYCPTHQQDSSCSKDLVVRQDSVKGQSQRRFRLLPSLKNLHAQAKSHAKRLTVEEKPIAPEKPEAEFPQVMDIHSALRLKGISPLHGPSGEQDFNQECEDMMASRPDSRHQSARKLSAPGLRLDTTDLDLAADEAYYPISRHKSAVSEAPTVDTDILNSDWPQPPTTHPPLPPLMSHQQFGPALAAVFPAPQQEVGKYTTAPSPPPTYPLPPVPMASESPRRQPSIRSLVNPITGVNLGLSLKKYNLPNTKSACSKTNNRIKALAANRGLSVDACLTNDASSDCEMAGDPVVDPLPSPLNARFKQSSRNSKVRELKKRHMSLLHKDIPVSVHCHDKLQGRAVPGPGSSKVPTSVYTKELPKRPVFIDQRKPLPQIPTAARYRRSSEASANVTKANIGKSRHARSVSAWSSGSNRQATEVDQDDSLALSEVMVMVDSSPRQTRDFRAGAIRVARPPRRKSSLNKGQTLPALRYQPDQTRQLQPRVSSSLPIRDLTDNHSSLTVVNTETRSQNDIVTTYVIPREGSGTISPSKASSILEPSPVSLRESDQYKSTAQRTPTPVRHVRNRQYIPAHDKSGSCSPSAGKGRSASRRSASKKAENENLYEEINRMVFVQHDSETLKDSIYGSKPGSADRLRSQPASRQRARPALSSATTMTETTNELLAHIEADLVRANLSRAPTSPLASRRAATLQPCPRLDDSDTSITPKSSFRSTCSESSSKQARKNSDASMTDPNDYEGGPHPPKDMSRLILVSTPPRPRVMDTTLIKSKKRYSNMPSWASRSKANVAAARVFSDPISSRTTPYTFSKQGTHTVQSTPPHYPRINANINSSAARPYTPTPDSSDIEITHFLTEADQMDNAIESFVQSTSRSASSTSSSCRSRTRMPIHTSSPCVSQRHPRQSQRYSAMSNISNIVDLQRIQDQINAVTGATENNTGTPGTGVGSDGYTSEAERSVMYGLAMGTCREQEEIDDFGRISLVARPKTT